MKASDIILAGGHGIGLKKVYGLVSGGKDSMSATHIAHLYKPIDGVLLIDTTIPAMNGNDKPAYIAAKNYSKRIGVPFICIKPLDSLRRGFEYVKSLEDYGMGKAFESYCVKYGFPHAGQHNQVYRYLKAKAMAAFVIAITESGDRVGFISGARFKESDRRGKNAQLWGIDAETPRIIWISPIYYWTTSEAFSYVKEQGFELSESYTSLHISGDCLCGAYAEKGEHNLLNVFYPDSSRKISRIEGLANQKHKGKPHWGNDGSVTGSMKNCKLTLWACADCQGGEVPPVKLGVHCPPDSGVTTEIKRQVTPVRANVVRHMNLKAMPCFGRKNE